jgi:MoxR-like ATPase
LSKPPEDEFYVPDDVWEQLCYANGQGKNVLATGPSGCGKTELFYRVATASHRPIVTVNCGAMSEPRSTLIGNTHFDHGKGTYFTQSRFAQAVQRGDCCILLDEISRASPDAFNILLTVMDWQGYLAPDESEDGVVIRRAPGVIFFATANLGMEYTGADQLDRAVAERFPTIIAMDFPPLEKERRLLRHRCPGLSQKDAIRLVEVAAQQRALARDGEFVGSISTRALLAAGEQIAAGISFENALKYCILTRFSADGGEASEQVKLLQVVQRVGIPEAEKPDVLPDVFAPAAISWGFIK